MQTATYILLFCSICLLSQLGAAQDQTIQQQLELQYVQKIQNILEGQANETAHAIDNKEYASELQQLQSALNGNVTQKIIAYYKFDSYDSKRKMLEQQLNKQIQNYENLLAKLKAALHKTNEQKAVTLSETIQRIGRANANAATAQTAAEAAAAAPPPDTTSLKQFERRLLKLLQKYGLYGTSASGIVNTLLADEEQLKRLQEKLIPKDDDDWSIWDIFC